MPLHVVISREQLLTDLQHVASQLGRQRVGQSDYHHLGRYSVTTICRRFPSWRSAMEQAGLRPMQY